MNCPKVSTRPAMNIAHLVRWFTELQDGDFPVRYVSLPI